MTKAEYDDYVARVKAFYGANIGDYNNSFSTIEYGDETFFSWSPCECCKRPLGGDRYEVSICVADSTEILTSLAICTDCYYYSHYGQLDDMTMLEVAQDEARLLAEHLQTITDAVELEMGAAYENCIVSPLERAETRAKAIPELLVAIFAQNARPNGDLIYCLRSQAVNESVEMVWPDGNSNGGWRYVKTVINRE